MATQTIDQTPLEATEYEIAETRLELERVNEEIGRAYARQRKGDKKAASDLGKLGMKRSTLESELHDLQLTERALKESAAAEAAAAAQRRTETLADDLKRVTALARMLEMQLGEQVITAGETAQRLRQVEQDWQRLRVEAAKAGVDVSRFAPRPAPATTLMRPGVVDEPAREVALWRNQYIEKTPIPPRKLSGFEQALKAETQALNAAREGERSQALTISEKVHEKESQPGRKVWWA